MQKFKGPDKPNSPVQKRTAKSHKSNKTSASNEGLTNSPRGNSLPGKLRGEMEASFGVDFSSVRWHNDAESARKTSELGALAYTQGEDIYFNKGMFSPSTMAGKHLLGHELTHVVQQRSGRVKPQKQAKGLPINEETALEKEANEMGEKAAKGEKVNLPSGDIQNPVEVGQMWNYHGRIKGIVHVNDTARDRDAEGGQRNELYVRQINIPLRVGSVSEWRTVLEMGSEKACYEYLIGFLLLATRPHLVHADAATFAAALQPYYAAYSSKLVSEYAGKYQTSEGLGDLLATWLGDELFGYEQQIISNYINTIRMIPSENDILNFLEALLTTGDELDLPYSTVWERSSIMGDKYALFNRVGGDIISHNIRILFDKYGGAVVSRISGDPSQRVLEQESLVALGKQGRKGVRNTIVLNAGSVAFKSLELLSCGENDAHAYQLIGNSGHMIRAMLGVERKEIENQKKLLSGIFGSVWAAIPGGGLFSSMVTEGLFNLLSEGIDHMLSADDTETGVEKFRIRFERAATNLAEQGYLNDTKANAAITRLYSSMATY